MFLNNFFFNLIKRINKYIKIPKTYLPFVQSLYQNRTDLSHLGGQDKGFCGIIIILKY